MKISFSLFGLFLCIVSNAQSPTHIDMLQGYWVQDSEEDLAFYKYYEGQNLYEIIDWGDHISVSKYFISFLNNPSDDSVSLLDLAVDGDSYAIFDALDIKDESYISVGSNIYSFDLSEDYFNFYANNPVSHYKIDSLPPNIYSRFLLEKEKLDNEVVFDFVPNYLRKEPYKLPNQIEAVSNRVYFHIMPEVSTKKKAFIVSGDHAKVLYQKRDWYYIIYYGASINTVGWVKKSDVKISD